MPHVVAIGTYPPFWGAPRIFNLFGAFDTAPAVRAAKLRKAVSRDLSRVWEAVPAVMLPEGPRDNGE